MIKFFKNTLIITLEIAVISAVVWFIAQKKGIQSPAQILPAIEQTTQKATGTFQGVDKKTLPAPEGQVAKTFNWQYKNKNYTLQLNLYKTLFDFYASQPKTYSYIGSLPVNWEEDYYGMFLKQNQQDQTVTQLAGSLQELGRKNKLSEDQIVELTMAFVQSIPYDDARAKEILSKDGNAQMQYPYETLYRQLGVCSDKSLLATALLRQMGYGVALFAYEQDNHMAIGIQCPKNYSTYGSGYCFAETTTTGNKIGMIPSFDSASNKTIAAQKLINANENQIQQTNLQQLGVVTIFQKTAGKEYDGIIQTNKIIQEIDQLKKTINDSIRNLQNQQKNINQQQSNLLSIKNKIDSLNASQNIEKYNSLVGDYNNLLKTYQKDVKNYNNNVTLYNQTIERYNTLIKE